MARALPSCIQDWILKENEKWKWLACVDLESRSEREMTKFVIANKNDLSAICGESFPIIFCHKNHKDFIAMEYKSNVMTPTTLFYCDDLSCDVYLCLPSGKVLDDCIKYFHTLVNKFKCIVIKPRKG